MRSPLSVPSVELRWGEMASKYCTKCGMEGIAGKRFCRGCGQAMPEAAVSPDESVVAAPVCGECGAALIAGKRFWRQCGHAVGGVAAAAEPAQVPEPCPAAETVWATDSAVPLCQRCGGELALGKRFCKLCGQPVDAAPASHLEADAAAPEAETELP